MCRRSASRAPGFRVPRSRFRVRVPVRTMGRLKPAPHDRMLLRTPLETEPKPEPEPNPEREHEPGSVNRNLEPFPIAPTLSLSFQPFTVLPPFLHTIPASPRAT